MNTTDAPVTEYVNLLLQDSNNGILKIKTIEFKIPTTDVSTSESSNVLIQQTNPGAISVINNQTANPQIDLKESITKEELLNSISSTDESNQTYVVETSDGSETVSHGDRLIVKAENGKSIRVYEIVIPLVVTEVEQGELGNFVAKIPNTSLQELQQNIQMYTMTSEGHVQRVNAEITNGAEVGEYSFRLENAVAGVTYRIDSVMKGRQVNNLARDIVWNISEEEPASEITTSQARVEGDVPVPTEGSTSAEGNETALQYTTEDVTEWTTELNN